MRRDPIDPEDELVAALCQTATHNPKLRRTLLGKSRGWLDERVAGQVAKAISGDEAARRRCVLLFRHLPVIRADMAGKPRPRPRLVKP